MALVLVVALLAPAPALASTIEVTFTGLANAFINLPCEPHVFCSFTAFINQPFTADFVFDTALGTLTSNPDGSDRLDGGLVSATIDLGDDL